jgi:hypothetical protein
MIVELKVGLEALVDDCESKLENDTGSNVGTIEEPNDSERFISGGERSEETVRRWLGGVLWTKFAMSCRMCKVCLVVMGEKGGRCSI